MTNEFKFNINKIDYNNIINNFHDSYTKITPSEVDPLPKSDYSSLITVKSEIPPHYTSSKNLLELTLSLVGHNDTFQNMTGYAKNNDKLFKRLADITKYFTVKVKDTTIGAELILCNQEEMLATDALVLAHGIHKSLTNNSSFSETIKDLEEIADVLSIDNKQAILKYVEDVKSLTHKYGIA